jgi:hypothetical protein
MRFALTTFTQACIAPEGPMSAAIAPDRVSLGLNRTKVSGVIHPLRSGIIPEPGQPVPSPASWPTGALAIMP